jgi:predicted secreted protein
MNPRLSLLFLLGLLATSAAMAGEEPRYNQVELSIEASAEVDNDTLVAELYIQHQAKTAAEAAERVNAAIGWGVGKAKAVDTVEVRTLDYTTNPVYSQRPRSSGGEPFTPEITAWRVSQAMRLQSTDADGLSELVTQLQERLAIRSMGYEISTSLRETTNARLIDEAIKAFQQRAQRIAGGFGHAGYKLVQVSINTGSERPPMPFPRTAAMEMAAPSPVTVEAGSSRLRVTISGSVELE